MEKCQDRNEGCQVPVFKVVFIININMEHLVSQYVNWTLECFIGQAHDVPTAVTGYLWAASSS